MTRQFAGYEVDKADAPAVDIQQAGGAFQRLTFSVVVFLGALGAVVLLGTLSLAVILAQVVALVLLGFAPVALVIGIFPGAGHDVFRGWLTKLATAVFIKALYSLVIALVVAVSAALTAATGSLGFLFAFGLQTLFFWALFVYRKQITARLVSATTGGAHHEGLPRASVVQRGATAAAAPVTALVGSQPPRLELGRHDSRRARSAATTRTPRTSTAHRRRRRPRDGARALEPARPHRAPRAAATASGDAAAPPAVTASEHRTRSDAPSRRRRQ